MAGAFRILDFDDPEDPDVVYLESHVGALYLQRRPRSRSTDASST